MHYKLLRIFLSGKNMEDDVNRFIEAQDGGQYEKALARLCKVASSRIGCGTYFRRCAALVTAECRVITV